MMIEYVFFKTIKKILPKSVYKGKIKKVINKMI